MLLKLGRLEFISYWSLLAMVNAGSDSSLVWSQVINSVPFRKQMPFYFIIVLHQHLILQQKKTKKPPLISLSQSNFEFTVYLSSFSSAFAFFSPLEFVRGSVVSAQPLPLSSALTDWFLSSIHASLRTDWLPVSQLQPISHFENLSV